jgi:plasmid stabilization system protein ParE
MSYKIIWQHNSEITYLAEIDYIFFKWNQKEVEKFQELVIENLDRLSINPLLGKYDSKLKLYFFVISKQTTLYYSINQNAKIIDLHIFWNTQKNPEELNKLL